MPATKRCWDCEEDRPLDAFGSDARRRDGLKPQCRTCVNAEARRLRARRAAGEAPVLLRTEKRCAVCKETKPVTAFAGCRVTADRLQNHCRECQADTQRAERATDPHRIRARDRAAYHANRDNRRESNRQWLRRTRAAVIAGYGSVCACCGEEREEFLCVDHVDGLGDTERESTYTLYRRLIREGFPAAFRLLCWNCNSARGVYGYCPHEREALREVS